jgi:hypothetical protein
MIRSVLLLTLTGYVDSAYTDDAVRDGYFHPVVFVVLMGFIVIISLGGE